MRFYFGTNTLNVITAELVATTKTDWPLTLVSASPTGTVTCTIPFLDANLYNKPDNVIMAFVPGAALDPSLTAAQVLALPGVSRVSVPFPMPFGSSFQDITALLSTPIPVGPVVVVIVGEFVD